jgi:hypothetical protein
LYTKTRELHGWLTSRCGVRSLELLNVIERKVRNGPHVDEALGVAAQKVFLRFASASRLDQLHRGWTRKWLFVLVGKHTVEEWRVLSDRRTVKFFVVWDGAEMERSFQ